jgi:hypothetical protein
VFFYIIHLLVEFSLADVDEEFDIFKAIIGILIRFVFDCWEFNWWACGKWMCRMEMEPGKLFIGGISWDTNEDRLKEYFQSFGVVVEAVIMKDRATGRARGFGFVVFADPAVAERVVMEKHVIDGRTVSLYVWIHSFMSARFDTLN